MVGWQQEWIPPTSPVPANPYAITQPGPVTMPTVVSASDGLVVIAALSESLRVLLIPCARCCGAAVLRCCRLAGIQVLGPGTPGSAGVLDNLLSGENLITDLILAYPES